MGDRNPASGPAVEWPLAYLTGTALSIGLLVGVRSGILGPLSSSELAAAGLVVGLYTGISLLHYRRAVATREPVPVALADER